MTEKAKEVSAFVTSHGLYEYNVLPFGLKNAPATFQRMINNIIVDLPNTTAYLDDIATGNNTWHERLESVERLLVKLRDANLTGNLMKSEFGGATITYLGHVVGQEKRHL